MNVKLPNGSTLEPTESQKLALIAELTKPVERKRKKPDGYFQRRAGYEWVGFYKSDPPKVWWYNGQVYFGWDHTKDYEHGYGSCVPSQTFTTGRLVDTLPFGDVCTVFREDIYED